MITLYNHQEVALALLRLNDSFALFMEQGTGKSFPILFRLAELVEFKRVHSALIIAPAAVCESWRDKINHLSEEQQQLLLHDCNLQIVSYDTVWRRSEYIDRVWDAVVLDESHYIKTPSAKRTKACIKLCANAKYRYLLTGTPTSNGQLCNIWAQLTAIDPVKVRQYIYPRCLGGDSYYKWIERVAYLNQYHKPYRYRNVKAIQQVINEWSYRITKRECLDLPEKLPDEKLKCTLSPTARRMYQDMCESSAVVELDTIAENPAVRMLKLRQIASGFMSEDNGETVELSDHKIKALKGFLKDYEKKLVIFCEFRHSIDAVSKLLKQLKIRHVILDGRQRDKGVWRTFQDDKRTQVIICQYAAGSAGIDLFAADTIVFFEPTLSSNLNEQAKDRIHRVGQHQPCSYYYLLTKGTVEIAIYRALNNYADFSEALFTRYLNEYEKGEKLNDY